MFINKKSLNLRRPIVKAPVMPVVNEIQEAPKKVIASRKKPTETPKPEQTQVDENTGNKE